MNTEQLQQIVARGAQRARRVHNAQVSDWYRVQANSGEGRSTAQVHIYDAIGGWFGVDAAQLVREIIALDVDDIEVHLNSPGGSAFDSIAIHNALRQHSAAVNVVVDGLAASGASLIAMAGDKVTMANGAIMMIHNSSGACLGNSDDMRKVAAALDKVDESQASLYAAKAGGKPEDWRSAMAAETWYTAKEAVDAGLADEVDAATDADDPEARFDLSIFAHAGRSHSPAPVLLPAAHTSHHTPPAEPAETNQPLTEGADMASDTLISGLRERLGINADAELDDAGILAAVDEALAEHAESTTTVPDGTQLVDSAVFAQMQADAAQGREARQQQLQDRRESLIQAALNDGRITPASVVDWRDSLTGDPQSVAKAEKILASLAKGAVPVEAKGYAGGADESNDDDRELVAARKAAGWGEDN